MIIKIFFDRLHGRKLRKVNNTVSYRAFCNRVDVGTIKNGGVFYVDDDTMREIEKIARKIDQKQAAAGDVHPSQPALILRADYGETVQERPMFKYDFEERRCLIPAGKFYEWKQVRSRRKV